MALSQVPVPEEIWYNFKKDVDETKFQYGSLKEWLLSCDRKLLNLMKLWT